MRGAMTHYMTRSGQSDSDGGWLIRRAVPGLPRPEGIRHLLRGDHGLVDNAANPGKQQRSAPQGPAADHQDQEAERRGGALHSAGNASGKTWAVLSHAIRPRRAIPT